MPLAYYTPVFIKVCVFLIEAGRCDVARCIFLVHFCKFDNVAQFGCFTDFEAMSDFFVIWTILAGQFVT